MIDAHRIFHIKITASKTGSVLTNSLITTPSTTAFTGSMTASDDVLVIGSRRNRLIFRMSFLGKGVGDQRQQTRRSAHMRARRHQIFHCAGGSLGALHYVLKARWRTLCGHSWATDRHRRSMTNP
ncbi:unnamed protein product [Prorocentrum cordatum]|uniref:Uncharacterized protein n=1 Tax=Prorocentrum cordatum TaxID=2364126 RepID=A0ABN9PER1_9DINO|nr:unnamed protein product [Polarella glacialis]